MGRGRGMLNSIACPNHRCFNTELADNTVQYRTFLPPLLVLQPYRLLATRELALLTALRLGRLLVCRCATLLTTQVQLMLPASLCRSNALDLYARMPCSNHGWLQAILMNIRVFILSIRKPC